MAHVTLIWHNVLNKPSELIAIANSDDNIERLILSHMHSTYPAHNPKLIYINGIYKIESSYSKNILPDEYYATEFININERRL